MITTCLGKIFSVHRTNIQNYLQKHKSQNTFYVYSKTEFKTAKYSQNLRHLPNGAVTLEVKRAAFIFSDV